MQGRRLVWPPRLWQPWLGLRGVRPQDMWHLTPLQLEGCRVYREGAMSG